LIQNKHFDDINILKQQVNLRKIGILPLNLLTRLQSAGSFRRGTSFQTKCQQWNLDLQAIQPELRKRNYPNREY